MSNLSISCPRWITCVRHPRILPLRPFASLGSLGIAAAVVLTFGCATPTASLQISAPSSTVAGSPFTITVTAVVGGSRDKIFNSIIHFTSSDVAAVLPPDYRFTTADAGSHTFGNGITLMTAGNQSIMATDTVASSISTTANVTVSAAAAAQYLGCPDVTAPETVGTQIRRTKGRKMRRGSHLFL